MTVKPFPGGPYPKHTWQKFATLRLCINFIIGKETSIRFLSRAFPSELKIKFQDKQELLTGPPGWMGLSLLSLFYLPLFSALFFSHEHILLL